jgi:hypothetical protein
MPPLTLLKPIGNLIFLSKMYKLPVATATSSGGDKGWTDAYHKDRKDQDMGGVPQTIPPWFMPQKMGFKPHQKSCDETGKNFKDFHDTMIDAVDYALTQWRLAAKLQNLKVNALTALGTPGCLNGDPLESNIKGFPAVNSMTQNGKDHAAAVAKGISDCFKKWQDQVMVPGLPWYPAFVAFPGPQTPPMPNIPTPLIACVSPMMTQIILPTSMASAMDDALPQKLKDMDPEKHYEGLHLAIATVVSMGFIIWLAAQQVMCVLGSGPVPTFAPPFVPVGPVVMGQNNPMPNHMT